MRPIVSMATRAARTSLPRPAQTSMQEDPVAPQVKVRQASGSQTTPVEGKKLAADAYIFGYPLVLMDATRRVMTAVPHPDGMRAPMNQFAHVRAFPDLRFTDVVSPNADTLY